MKITIERASLLKSLAHVQSVVEKRNTIPVLSNVKLEAKDGKLTLNATDMDMEIAEIVDADVETNGATTVPAHTLYDIARKLPDGTQVELIYPDSKGHLTIAAGRSKFSLACIDVADFPQISGENLPTNFSMKAEELRDMIDRTRFAVSTEETRYYLNGIYIHRKDNGEISSLKAAATDGHRLATVEYLLPAGAENLTGIIIPRKAVNEIRKIADETEEDILISMSESKVRFKFDNIILSTKLIDGTYPDYERVIPKDNDKVLEVEVSTLRQAVERVSIVSERSRGIKFAVSNNLITITASSVESGSAMEEVEASFEGNLIEIGFNFRYLLDILNEIKGDSVRLLLADSASPTILKDESDVSATYVLMPMRV